jgi:DNA-binding response OmpR family regulator
MTKKEFDLLVFMITNKNKVITRELLLESIWKNDYEVYERTVDELIKRLRKKLITYNSKVIITAVRGVGFRIEEKN